MQGDSSSRSSPTGHRQVSPVLLHAPEALAMAPAQGQESCP